MIPKKYLAIVVLLGLYVLLQNFYLLYKSKDTTSPKLGNLFSVTTVVHHVSESVEEAWKNSRFHHDIQHLSNKTQNQLPQNNKTYLYIHVPRTGGDSLATHLFSLPKEQKFNGEAWWGKTGVPNLYQSLQESNDFQGPLNYKRLYKGFFSNARVTQIIDRATHSQDQRASFNAQYNSLQMFTILRHPHERLVSIYKHWKKYGDAPCDGSFHDFVRQIDTAPSAYTCNATNKKSDSTYNYHFKHQSFGKNGMLYQMGDILQMDFRTLPPEEAYAKATDFIDSMTFLGFYEDWNIDYHRLAVTIFPEWDGKKTAERCWWIGLLCVPVCFFTKPVCSFSVVFALLWCLVSFACRQIDVAAMVSPRNVCVWHLDCAESDAHVEIQWSYNWGDPCTDGKMYGMGHEIV